MFWRTDGVQAEAPKSGPIDKALGREADPEGGKVYDNGSAWAGAYAYSKHLTDKESQVGISIMSAQQRISWSTKDFV